MHRVAMSSRDRSEVVNRAACRAGSDTRFAVRSTWMLAVITSCYVAGVVARPLVAPDEFRYAEVPREMLSSGDFVVPRLDGVLYFEKPPLGYWLVAASMSTFGENAVAVRLPFTLATLLTAAIVFALTRRFGSGLFAARWAAIGFASSI